MEILMMNNNISLLRPWIRDEREVSDSCILTFMEYGEFLLQPFSISNWNGNLKRTAPIVESWESRNCPMIRLDYLPVTVSARSEWSKMPIVQLCHSSYRSCSSERLTSERSEPVDQNHPNLEVQGRGCCGGWNDSPVLSLNQRDAPTLFHSTTWQCTETMCGCSFGERTMLRGDSKAHQVLSLSRRED
jgi:hypothetical protein